MTKRKATKAEGNGQIEKMADGLTTAQSRALWQEVGATGLTRFGVRDGKTGESIVEEQLSQLRGASGRKIFREMRVNHPVVSAVVSAIGWAMRSIEFSAESSSDSGLERQSADFLDECLEDMSFSFSDEMSFIIDPMLEQGFSLLELVYKKRLGSDPRPYGGVSNPASSKFNDGKVGWRKWAPRPATSLAAVREWVLDETGGIQGINQAPTAPTWKTTFISIERLLNFRTTAAPSNAPHGLSLLRPMYQPWYFATQIAEIEAIGIERDLAGLPVAYLGSNTSLDPNDSNSDYKLIKEMVVNIRRDAMEGVVLPGPKMTETTDGRGFLLELLSTGGSRQFDTSAVLHRYHTLMAMSALAQFIFLGLEKVGSYALATVHSEYFNLALRGWADNIADVLNRHAIPRLFALNPSFARLKELPRLKHSEAGIPNLEQLGKMINELVGVQVLTPDENLENYIRMTARLPEKMEPETITLSSDDKPEEFAELNLPSKRMRRGGPLFERRTNEYQAALEQMYIEWYGAAAKELAAEDDDDEREALLAAALLLLRDRLIRLGREKLPEAPTVGAGGVPLSPDAWAVLQREIAENERFITTSFVPAVEQKTRLALRDDSIRDEASIAGVFQTFLGRVSLYAGSYWYLIWAAGWKERVDEEGRKAEEEGKPPPGVRWMLDPQARHCPDCLIYAGSYDSIDDLLASTGNAMPSRNVQCDGRCRCHLEFDSDSGWRR